MASMEEKKPEIEENDLVLQQNPNVQVSAAGDDMVRRLRKLKLGTSRRYRLETLALQVLSLETLEPFLEKVGRRRLAPICEYFAWKNTTLGPTLHLLDRKVPRGFKKFWWEFTGRGAIYRSFVSVQLLEAQRSATVHFRDLSTALSTCLQLNASQIIAEDKAKNPLKWTLAVHET